jgi:hypothetical protein
MYNDSTVQVGKPMTVQELGGARRTLGGLFVFGTLPTFMRNLQE